MDFFTLASLLLGLLTRSGGEQQRHPEIEALVKQLVDRITALETKEAEEPLPEPIDVLKAQTQLKALGFDPGPLDGKFGRLTKAGVTAYQTARGDAPVDGLLDRGTYDKIMSEVAP